MCSADIGPAKSRKAFSFLHLLALLPPIKADISSGVHSLANFLLFQSSCRSQSRHRSLSTPQTRPRVSRSVRNNMLVQGVPRRRRGGALHHRSRVRFDTSRLLQHESFPPHFLPNVLSTHHGRSSAIPATCVTSHGACVERQPRETSDIGHIQFASIQDHGSPCTTRTKRVVTARKGCFLDGKWKAPSPCEDHSSTW